MDIQKILYTIELLEKQKSNQRKVTSNDLKNPSGKKKKENKKTPKIKGYRAQEEYGEKKFIKPWRTGTKSQQQPPKSGKKAGGRGQQRV